MKFIKTCIETTEYFDSRAYKAARNHKYPLKDHGYHIDEVNDTEEADIVFKVSQMWDIKVIIDDSLVGYIGINEKENGELAEVDEKFNEAANFQRQLNEILEEHL
jgi:hypothetical protein